MDLNDSYSETIDYDRSDYNWNELVPVLVCYGITFCFGSIGNALIVYAIYRFRRMQSVTNVFLASLAIADLLLIIVCIPVKVAKLFSYSWEAGWFLCKFTHYIQTVSMICSVLTLTDIGIERYYAIVHPMRARYICTTSQARRVILLTWVLSFLLATPIIYIQIILQVGDDENTLYWCIRDWSNSLWLYHEIYILIIVLVLPFCAMSFTYVNICWEVWHFMERRTEMTSVRALSRSTNSTECKDKNNDAIPLQALAASDQRQIQRAQDDSKTVKSVVCMLVVIVFVFAICWAPYLVDNVLTAYGILSPVRGGAEKHMATIFHLMAYFNSCINPVIYGFMSKNFRDSFRSVLCCYQQNLNGRTTIRTPSSMRQGSRTCSQTRHTLVQVTPSFKLN